MSALPPKADIRPRDQDVCFGPLADIEHLATRGGSREGASDRLTKKQSFVVNFWPN
jgi:hypothetical protein